MHRGVVNTGVLREGGWDVRGMPEVLLHITLCVAERGGVFTSRCGKWDL